MTTITPYTSRKIAILSFLSIIFVVFIHARTIDHIPREAGAIYDVNFLVQHFVAEGPGRVAVPFFFAFSAFLFFATLTPTVEGFKKKLGSRVKTLLGPYLLWNILGLLVLLLVQSLHGSVSINGEKLISNYTVIDFLGRLYPHPVQFQFWFLLDLFVYMLASPLLYVLIRYTGPLVPLAMGALYLSPVCLVPLYISDAALHPEGMFYFSLGAWAALHKFRVLRPRAAAVVTLTMIWLIVSAAMIAFLLYREDSYLYQMARRISVFLGVFCAWRVYDLAGSSWINHMLWKQLTPCTFFVYAFHEPMQTILRNELLSLTGSGPLMYTVSYAVCPAVTIALALALSAGLQRFMPAVFSALVGGRTGR
jgi:hypothetical protein